MNVLDLIRDELKQALQIKKVVVDYVPSLPDEQECYSFPTRTLKSPLTDRPYWVSWSDHLGAWVSSDGSSVQVFVSDRARLLDPGELTLGFTSVLTGICLNLQGQVAVHANAVILNGYAIAFIGYSGVGKSTLSAFCSSQGAGFLTDDVLVVNEEGYVLPGNPRIKLYPETGASLGFETLQDTDYKIFYNPRDLGASLAQQLVPLGLLYLLAESETDQIYAETVSPSQAVFDLLTHGYDVSYFIPQNPKLFDAYIRLVYQVPVRRLFYPRDFGRLVNVYDFLLKESLSL